MAVNTSGNRKTPNNTEDSAVSSNTADWLAQLPHVQNVGNFQHFRASTFQNFPREDAPSPPWVKGLIRRLFSYYFLCHIAGRQTRTQSLLMSLGERQPRPQGLLLVQNGGRRNPWPRLLKYSTNGGVFCHVTHDEMAFSDVVSSVWRPYLFSAIGNRYSNKTKIFHGVCVTKF